MTAVWLRLLVFMALGWVFLGAVATWAKGPAERKVVFIAGKKSHGPGVHEYEKDVELLKYCMDHSPSAKGIKTEAYFNDWPGDPSVLDDADTIVMISDGSDQNEQSHPLLQGDHLAVFEKQMKRGCGFVAIHYTTFAPSKKAGDKLLEWIGGYFDYQQGNASNHWYSKIMSATATVTPASPEHPICRGLKPYQLSEEFYYNMRFRENDPRLAPILTVRLPGEPQTQTIAWAVERRDGGRGFAFTGGHDHGNWKLDGYRKMILNAILWTARGNVPAEGVESAMPPADLAKDKTAAKPIKALILSGPNPPPGGSGGIHPETKAGLMAVLKGDSRFAVDVASDPEFLGTPGLFEYDLLLPDEVYWSRGGLSEKAKANFLKYVSEGKGLAIIHFADGAFTASPTPIPPDKDWPAFREVCRRVWVEDKSKHDAYGPFKVTITGVAHPITEGMRDFETTDELYYDQQGTQPIEPLAVARSRDSGRDEPLAFVYAYGKGRVFQCLLGHDAGAFQSAGVGDLMRHGCAWAAGRDPKAGESHSQ